jgi:hypothetical protein
MSVQLPMADPRPVRENRPTTTGAGSSGTNGAARASRPQVAAARDTGRRLSPRLRKWIVAAHTLVGVGWFGVTVAKLVLDVVAATTSDLSVARASFVFASAFDGAVFPPVSLATLITGIVLAVGTAWGLVRHWWIVVKLALTVGAIVTGVAFVGAWTEQGLVAPDAELGAVSLRLIAWASVHALMLAAATIISVLKPWGRIRPGHQATVRRPAPARSI